MKASKLSAFIGIGASLLISQSVLATENGAPTTAPGIYGFGAGFMPLFAQIPRRTTYIQHMKLVIRAVQINPSV